jgi:hypothetical protein
MPMNLEKNSLENINKNVTTIHKNSLQYEVHPYTTQVLRKTQRNSPQYVQHENQSSSKISWPNKLLLINDFVIVHESSKEGFSILVNTIVSQYTMLEEPKSHYLDTIPILLNFKCDSWPSPFPNDLSFTNFYPYPLHNDERTRTT